MDLSWSPDQQVLRREAAAWIEENRTWDPAVGPPVFEDLTDEVTWLREWQRRLASGRWVGVAWPRSVGGRGAGQAENYLVQEELARAGSPELIGRIGVNLAGPTLLRHGTQAQQARWLPPILTADELWCQLFSEPGAGSDLASLSTRAERVPGGWQVTGTKVWTSYAQFADWGLCLARTDLSAPRHRGISYFVVRMHAPGVEVRPLRQMTGDSEFNEVFLDEVFVPSENMVGAENAGWHVAMSTLSHERGTSPRQLVKHMQLMEDLLALAHAGGAFDDPATAERLAASYTDMRIFQLHNWRTVSRLSRGEEPGPEGSILKLFWSERSRQLHDTAMEVLGPAAPLWRGAAGNEGNGRWQRSFLYNRAATIFGGTSEIQRNTIGERILGLPRDLRPVAAHDLPNPPIATTAKGPP